MCRYHGCELVLHPMVATKGTGPQIVAVFSRHGTVLSPITVTASSDELLLGSAAELALQRPSPQVRRRRRRAIKLLLCRRVSPLVLLIVGGAEFSKIIENYPTITVPMIELFRLEFDLGMGIDCCC